MSDEVLQDFVTDAADDACDAISACIDAARDEGTEWPLLHVVPCVPGEPIPAGAIVSGVKLARIDGVLGIYLFAEGSA